VIACVLAPAAVPLRAQDDKEKPVAKSKPITDEVFILGKQLGQLLDDNPDAVILTGEQAKKYLESLRAADSRNDADVTAQQCLIRGELLDDQALLHLEITATAARDGRNPLPIGLGEGNLLKLAASGQTPLLTRDNSGWTVWLDGKGRHTIMLDVQIALTGSTGLPALVCAIPEAPVTTLELRAHRGVSDVRLLPAVPVVVRPVADSKPHIEAALGPRGRLEVRWRWNDGTRRDPPPLLRANSLIAATVETGTIQLRTDLRLLVLRGSQQTFELEFSPDERVLEVRRSDGSDVPWQSRVESDVQRVSIQFPEPISGGAELVIASQTPWSGERAKLRGVSVIGAHNHRSMFALRPAADAPDWDVAATDVTNARRIGLESLDVPLRSLRNEIAFLAVAQPFQVQLSILPRRPSTTVRTTLVLSLDGEQAAVFQRWQFTVHGGKVPHVDFQLPEHFAPDHFISGDAIQSVRIAQPESGSGPRVARVFLNSTLDVFDLRLRAVVPLQTAKNLAKLDLPAPRDSSSEWTRLHLTSATDRVLEISPRLTPFDETLDSSLAAELTGPKQSARAFQTRSMLDRVAFRLSRALSAVRFQSGVQLRFDRAEAAVVQTFEFPAAAVRGRQLRFAVPEPVRNSVKLESPIGRVVSDPAESELVVRCDGELPESVRLQFSFRMPRELAAPTANGGELDVPLLRSLDGEGDTTELTVTAPAALRVELGGVDWRRSAQSTAAAGSDGPVTNQTFRRIGSTESLAFKLSAAPEIVPPRFVLDRAVIETTLGSGGEYFTHARYVVAATGPGRPTIRVPENCRVTQARWAGRPVLFRAAADTGVIQLNDELLGQLPAILEIDCEGVAPPRRAWGTMTWQPPTLAGDVSWGRVMWRLQLPDGVALLRGPREYNDENRLNWLGTSFGLAPKLDDARLNRWLGDSATASDVASGRDYLFSRLATAEPIAVAVVSRPYLVLASSGIVLLAGILLAAVPARARIRFVLLVLVAAAVLAAFEPTAAIECARSAGLGVLLVIVAGACQAWLSRRQARRRTVFPEAGVLAKAQANSNRSSAEFALGAAGSEPAAPPAPTIASPRRVAQSSSVR